MKLSLGYPNFESEMTMLSEYRERKPISVLSSVCKKSDVAEIIDLVQKITVSDQVKKYIVMIADKSRNLDRIAVGISPRGTLALMRAAQANAGFEGRDYVIPDDVKEVARPVLSHRIITRSQGTVNMSDTNDNIIDYIIDTVAVPIE